MKICPSCNGTGKIEPSSREINLHCLQGRQLMAALINHPSIAPALILEIGSLRFKGRDLEKLRQTSLTFIVNYWPMDSDSLKCKLCEKGYAPILDRLLHSSVYRLARFAHPDAPLTEVEGAIQHLTGSMRERHRRAA